MFAIHLARQTCAAVSVQIVEPRATLGAGLAYSTTDPAHRVNVPAAGMTLLPSEPHHFTRWLDRRRAIEADPSMVDALGLFPRRALFGTYVAETLAEAHGGLATIQHIRDAATRMTKWGHVWRIELGNGGRLEADLVVLATGHPPPAVPPALGGVFSKHRKIIVNPWAERALAEVRATDDILILGTGLTMADIVASLELRGHRGRITAVSRRGLLSRPHERPISQAWSEFASTPWKSAGDLVRQVRTAVTAAAAAGRPWQAVIRALVRDAQVIWAALPEEERLRLLRHLRPYWDVHRYRAAPQAEQAVHNAKEDGRLEVFTATLSDVVSVGTRLDVTLRPRGKGALAQLRRQVDAVVLAIGPAHRDITAKNSALASLVSAGLLRGDSYSLGVHVDRHSRVLNSEGQPDDRLLAVGPLARGTFGELVGLPHVTEHAAAVAGQAARWIEASAARPHSARRQDPWNSLQPV
ncbi:FAD/NAD(P)-binding protein [Belnapia sp. T6]|uniref:FAD/NAD(P)-binding protein n=1 Tax=Belnapia mucosa TaxID=2804532 RepID=A0ABS1VCL8_9PROT|nr:FAD/NAD(P)-binding protein [Belnapia mucosa]